MNVVFPDIVLFANVLLFLCVLHARQTKILERVESKNKIEEQENELQQTSELA